MGYSEEFDGFAADALNPELSEEERVAALKAAIMACMESGGEEDEEAPGSKPAGGLALVFGGPKKKGG